ncbi:MAG: hypothetical protein WC869_16505 [Phycisphaerae bacterium]|jgi:hypothetical protein
MRREFVCPKCGEDNEGNLSLLYLVDGSVLKLRCHRCECRWNEKTNDSVDFIIAQATQKVKR